MKQKQERIAILKKQHDQENALKRRQQEEQDAIMRREMEEREEREQQIQLVKQAQDFIAWHNLSVEQLENLNKTSQVDVMIEKFVEQWT